MLVVRNQGHLQKFALSNNHQLCDFWKFVFAKQPKQKFFKNSLQLVQMNQNKQSDIFLI